MEQNYKNGQDEISIKELIMTLIDERKLIITITTAMTLIALVLSFIIITPIYESSSSFVMTIPKSVQTKAGTYNYITTSYSDYLPLLKDHRVMQMTIDSLGLEIDTTDLEKRLSYIEPDLLDTTKRGIKLTVSGKDKEENTSIANIHINNYIEFLNIDFKDKALNQFVREYGVSLELVERNLNITEKKLEESNRIISEISPFITLQKALTSSPEVAAMYASEKGVNIKELTRDMLYDEVRNPNYASMDALILEYKKSISNSKIEIDRLNSLLNELNSEKVALNNYYSTGDKSKFTEGYVEVFNSKIQIMSPAFTPKDPISPKKLLILVLGLLIGLVIGIFVAIFKRYWENE